MKALREFIIRLFLREKPKGVMTALPNKDLVDMNIAIVAEKLMRNGIDPNSLKNANQVENAIKMIDDRPKVQEGITATKSAKIIDMEGKEIDPRSKIMGGKQAETEEEILERLNSCKQYLAREVTNLIDLKFSPKLVFRNDESINEITKIEKILMSEKVLKDIKKI